MTNFSLTGSQFLGSYLRVFTVLLQTCSEFFPHYYFSHIKLKSGRLAFLTICSVFLKNKIRYKTCFIIAFAHYMY